MTAKDLLNLRVMIFQREEIKLGLKTVLQEEILSFQELEMLELVVHTQVSESPARDSLKPKETTFQKEATRLGLIYVIQLKTLLLRRIQVELELMASYTQELV